MKNTERKSFRHLVGMDFVVHTTYSVEKGRIKGLLDLTIRNSSPGKAKNRFRILDATVQSALCT